MRKVKVDNISNIAVKILTTSLTLGHMIARQYTTAIGGDRYAATDCKKSITG